MNQQIINGVIYQGKSITVINGKVVIDGVDVTPDSKVINIEISGDVDELVVTDCNNIKVSGKVHSICTSTGDIHCGDVTGNVHTQTGDVKCGNIAGNVKTQTGDIKYKKL